LGIRGENEEFDMTKLRGKIRGEQTLMPRSQHFAFVRSRALLVMLFALLLYGLGATAQSNVFPKLVCSNEPCVKAMIESVTPGAGSIGTSAGGDRISITNLTSLHDTAKTRLGPPQTIHVIDIINSFEVKIESSGKYSTACIHNLPPEVIHFVQSIQQVRDNITVLEAQFEPDQTRSVAQQTALNEMAALNENRIRLRQLENESEPQITIIARPSEDYIKGTIRYWEFERMGMTNSNPLYRTSTYPSPYPY
jgi:hypothetical protein